MNEECDDRNDNDGDGCSSVCSIEYGYICNEGTSNTTDICTQCQTLYKPNKEKNKCELDDKVYSYTVFGYVSS